MNSIKKFYSTKRMQKIIISLLTAILIVGGVSFTMLYSPPTSKTDVSISLTSKDVKEKTNVKVNVVVNGDVEVLKDGKVIEDVSIAINEPVKLSKPLDIGTYTVHMISSPIESDGSIYKIPSKIDNIVISANSGKSVSVEVPLERIAVADMTKEQLGVVIERLEKESSTENKDLIETLKKRQETAVSDASSIKDVQQGSKAKEETPKVEDATKPENKPSTGNSGSSSSSGSSGGSTTEKHVHSFTTPNVVHHAEVPAQGYNETIPAVTQDHIYFLYSDGCKFEKRNSNDENIAIASKHIDDHGFFNYRAVVEKQIITPESTRWVETSPAIPAWDETDGYFCSCGTYRAK